MKRNTYHSSVKIAFALGLEQNWVSPSFIQSIPASTAHYWKKEKPEKYLGNQFAKDIDNDLSNVQNTFHSTVRFERSVFFAYVRLKILLFQVLSPAVIHQALLANKKQVVNTLDKIKSSLL